MICRLKVEFKEGLLRVGGRVKNQTLEGDDLSSDKGDSTGVLVTLVPLPPADTRVTLDAVDMLKNPSSPSSSSPVEATSPAGTAARVGARVLARFGRDLTRCWS
uniref:Uncharacterized protein n=1 Tax=Cacopsylla melanoneura TaxID=428564 RepID=A0A8D9FJZ1_9HEMI